MLTPTAAAAPPRHLETFARAIRDGLGVRLSYRAPRGAETDRDVTVLALGYRGGAWLAACHCGLRGSLRAFRLDRVSEARLAPAPAGPRPDFDGHAFALQGLLDPLDRRALRVAIRLAPPLAEHAAAVLPGLAELDGEARIVHLRASRPEAVVALALSLGDAAELVHPPELARVARRLRERAVPAGRA